MKPIEAIGYYVFVIGYIIMPFIAGSVLESRNVEIPSDLGGYGIIIWYAVGIIQMYWHDRHKEPPDNLPNNDRPSYTDRGQNG